MFKKLFLFILFSLIPLSAANAEWPEKPIKIVVPWAAGGSSDISARILADELSKKLQQNVIVENKPGASGMIGMKHVLESKPDGYTLVIAANSLVFVPIIYKSNLYDWKTQLKPIAQINYIPNVILTKPDSSIKSFEDFIKLGKENPEKITVADPGIGTNLHICIELINYYAKTKFTSVHYKGNRPATTDLLAGVVDAQVDQLGGSLELIKAGKLRALAITGVERYKEIPNVPTISELKVAGLENFSQLTTMSLFGPVGMPNEVIEKVGNAMKDVLSEQAVKDKFEKIGFIAKYNNSQYVWDLLMNEDKTAGELIKKLNISVE